jgi:hypothetical protein
LDIVAAGMCLWLFLFGDFFCLWMREERREKGLGWAWDVWTRDEVHAEVLMLACWHASEFCFVFFLALLSLTRNARGVAAYGH